jgi:hypothetical protein
MICVPRGRLKLDLDCFESGVPDRFKVKISTRPRSEFRRPSGRQAPSVVPGPGDKIAGLLSGVPPGRVLAGRLTTILSLFSQQ